MSMDLLEPREQRKAGGALQGLGVVDCDIAAN